jgi:choline dehydrogenase
MMKIDHHFLEEPEDLQEIKETFRSYVLKTSEALHKIDPAYGLLLPDEESIFDDNRLEAHIRSTFASSFHDQCSLIMGGEEDGGVVNGTGEVYGVKNLMVADASIIPYHMDGNTSGPSYLIGSVLAEELMKY